MGPLEGIKIVEFAGIGPAPFCGMLLADMGADVIRIDRAVATPTRHDAGRGGGDPVVREDAAAFLAKARGGTTLRGRPTLILDLKSGAGAATALALIERADALIEGFRPGVMERLGLGPDSCHTRNPRLVYGRVTGWGQEGPLAKTAGHDIDYIALTGALACIGEKGGPPLPPLNLVGDFGGGAMFLAFGLTCALVEARSSGRGQVVDAAMVDGAALLMANVYSRRAAGAWRNERGENALDGGAPWYRTYVCADGKYLAVGAIEPHFYALLLERCGIVDPSLRDQWNRGEWPAQCAAFAAVFRTRRRDEWCALLEGTDACVAPVLDLDEAPRACAAARPRHLRRGRRRKPARAGAPLQSHVAALARR